MKTYVGSLKTVFLISVVIIVCLTGFAVSGSVMRYYTNSLLRLAAERANNIAHGVSLDIADKLLINDLVSVQKIFNDQMKSIPSISYFFIVNNDKVKIHTFLNGIPDNLIPLNRPENGKTVNIVKYISQDNDRFIDVHWPIFGGRVGILRMGFSEAAYRDKISKLKLEIGVVTLGILGMSLVIAYIWISHLFMPLSLLTESVNKIDENNLDVRIDIKGRAEVTRIVSAYNRMLDRIRGYTLKLTDYNTRLEKKHKELDKVHSQLVTTFSISRKINGFTDSISICHYLVGTLTNILDCRKLNMLLFNDAEKGVLLINESEIIHLNPEDHETLYRQLDQRDNPIFLKGKEVRDLALPEDLKNTGRAAIFTVRYQVQLLAAMMIACPDDCVCVKTEMDVIHQVLEQSSSTLYRAIEHEHKIKDLEKRIEPVAGFGKMVGKDPKIQVIYKLIEDVAPTDTTVLILGESGTGKEVVAKEIHSSSTRSKKPFIVINCSAYPATLLESELFGHEKGAFTGATSRKTGRFEQADGGTVFLDEIGEISASAQTMLLRVLQSQKIERIGGSKSISVNIRVLAATNRDLMQDVKAGRFREDLYYRLNVIPIQLPTLRERRIDIPLLANHFLKLFADEQGKRIDTIDPEAMRLLLDHDWPGNIRELENSIEHAVTLSKSRILYVSDFPSFISHKDVSKNFNQSHPLDEVEKKAITQALETCKWNKSATAVYLKISRSTLYEKLKKYEINYNNN